MEYASKGVAGAGLGTGIAGLALGVLNGGGGLLPGLMGWGRGAGYGCAAPGVSHYELNQEQKIAELQAGIALRDANVYNDQKLLEVYKYFDGELRGIRAELCDQKVYNAANTANLNCMAGQIADLMALTKRVIPNGSLCPGWGDVTVTITPATTPTTTPTT